RQAGVQCDDAADRGRLHVRVALAEDHVVDDLGVDPGPLDECGEDLTAELLRCDVLELAAEAAHRRAERLADDDVVRGGGCLGHGVSSWVCERWSFVVRTVVMSGKRWGPRPRRR